MEFDLDALERRLLEYVARDGYQPVKPRVIIKKFGLDDEGKVAFRRLLKRLVRDGKLAYGANHLVRKADAVKPADGRIVGRFRRAMRGHGYVRPESPAPKGIVGDIYIPAGETGDAANGDRVAVRLSRRRHGGPTEPVGEIVEVLDRRTLKFVGTYLARGGGGFVRMDGNQFPDPIPVGDPGAKQVRDGDKVVVEMVRFPDSRTTGEAVVTEVLGRPDAVGVDTRMIVAEYDLPTEFPDEVVEEVRSIAAEFDESIAAPRRDLTGTTIITIDPATARDFDDAISLERIENGHWRLGVHIADVAHFVRPNSRVDGEALRRGNSVYLPDLVIPMLPELLSNGLASLQPDRVRYTLTAFVEFAPDGVPVATELCESAIRSCRRFTYEEIDQFLDDPDGWREKLTGDVHALLERMRDLARILRDRRMAAGSLDLAIPEVEIDLDADGRVVGAHKSVNTFSHQIIEEFMLAANVAVAQRIHGLGLPLVRRVHEPPGLMKLRELTEFVRALGIRCSGLHDRFEIKRVIAEAEGRPERDAIHFAVLRAMQKARYSSEELGHYALAFDAYCHFTSPIRRYPDLIIHRMVKALAAGTRPAAEAGHLEKLGEHCSETEQRAERAERELKKLKLLNFLKDKIGTELDARITGVESFGIFAQGEQLPADGYVAIRSLPPDLYDFDSVARSIVGRRSGETYRLGDSVVVKVARVDLARRELDFEIVRHRNRPVSIRPASNRSERSERATGEERPPRRPNGGDERRRGGAERRGASDSRGGESRGAGGGRPAENGRRRLTGSAGKGVPRKIVRKKRPPGDS